MSTNDRKVPTSRALLEDLACEDLCTFDHSGNCQAHGYSLDPGEVCPQQQLKQLLEEDDLHPEYAGLSPEAKWWAEQELGSTIHYHNGFGEYVRGVVVVLPDGQRGIKPLELVGNWDNSHAGYHAAKILGDNPGWQPHISNIYEHPSFTDDRGVNPLTTVPFSKEELLEWAGARSQPA